MNTWRSTKERLNQVTEMAAEGALALLRSLPFAWVVSRVNVSESTKVWMVPAEVR